MRNPSPLLAGVFAALLAVAGCTGDAGPSRTPGPGAAEPTPAYELTPRPVRRDEVALRVAPVSDGDTAFTPIGLTTGLPSIVGSHADFDAQGSFVRLRLVVVNNGRTNTVLDPRRQLLLDSAGAEHRPDPQAMTIKRQPIEPFSLGASVRLEFDLWYDIPAGAVPAALRAYGGASLTDGKDLVGTDIPLPR
ncbi:DUF4352 domain-containing protein [Rhizohabitans arisaemae]|uniref:DUF4352 domain-containing protein n=1 Tax=Rhizohabitans arisaemae TaxID=2720610 RepID=UPI0024B16178|nr:DUF4352 domain-containing protein [Rhizohabitans arisaemae]